MQAHTHTHARTHKHTHRHGPAHLLSAFEVNGLLAKFSGETYLDVDMAVLGLNRLFGFLQILQKRRNFRFSGLETLLPESSKVGDWRDGSANGLVRNKARQRPSYQQHRFQSSWRNSTAKMFEYGQ